MTGWVTDACSFIVLGNASLYCRLGWMMMVTDRATVDAVVVLIVTW